MFPDKEINEVYLKVDEQFKLKIKQQLKGTGLLFEKFLNLTDANSNRNYHSLVINKREIEFKSINELYEGILKVTQNEEADIQSQIDFFEDHKNNDLNPDTIAIDSILDGLYNRQYKLGKLKEKLLARVILTKNKTYPSLYEEK
jgi:hypothetical protein